MDLLQQFLHRNEGILHSNAMDISPVLLAVSGGMDSMCMAYLFSRSNLPFAIAHCNFQLRGEEADKDQQLVSEWAAKHNVPFHTVNFDTADKSAEWKKGTQETARILRYEWLDNIRQTNKYAYIATAHHANDNVETLLMNLFKGTGISGLHGIPLRNGNIIRPLLFAERSDIAAYVAANDIPYRDDASNATDAYLRNAVRHNIVPVINEWFPNAVQNVGQSIQRFSQAEELYRKAIDTEKKKLLEHRGKDIYIPVRKLNKRTPLETICYELFLPYGFISAQLPQILHLLTAETGKFIQSPTHRIIRNRDFLILTTIPQSATDFIAVDGVPCTIDTGLHKFKFTVINDIGHIDQDPGVAYIDMKRLTFPLFLRKWRTGDYFYPLGMQMKKKKIGRFLTDRKIPLHEKEHVWVLECDKRIAWVAGMRLDERFKIKDSTASVLKVSLTSS